MATQLQDAGAVVAPEVVEGAIEQDIGGISDGQQGRDYESEARELGWVPKDEFRGDESRWTDAESFVKRGETQMPLLKKQVETQKGEIDFLKRQVKKLAKAEQNAYNAALEDLKRQQREAVEYGDVAAFEKVEARIDALKADIQDEPQAKGENPDLAFAEFRDANEWYDLGALPAASEAERRARALADRIADKLAAQGLQRELTPSQFFARVAEQVKEQIPMLGDGKPARQKPASDVAGVTRQTGARNVRNGNALPPEAKAQAKRFFENGTIRAANLNEAMDKYAKSYAWDQ